MYSPQLGRFLSQDPLVAGQPDVLFDNDVFGDRLTMMRNLYGYANNNPVNVTDPSGEAPCPPGVFNAGKAACEAKNAGINRTWLIYGCKISYFCGETIVGTCCFGSCQFYEGWCKWGARLPKNDPGKKYWTLTLDQCEKCADACAKAKGKWPCKFGGGQKGPRWPSSKNPFVPVWDDDTKAAVQECQAAGNPAP